MEPKNQEGLTEKEYIAQYQPGDYDRPSVTVDMLIFAIDTEQEDGQAELLLIKRKNHPYIGQWAIPGGFVELNESLYEAAARELEEETGLKDLCLEQIHTFGNVKRDPRMRVISVSYMAVVPKNQFIPEAGDDALLARWFQVEKKKISDLENGSTYALTIENEEEQIFMSYRITETFERKGLMWKKDMEIELLPIIDMKNQDKMAFDHPKILNMAMDRLEEMEKDFSE